MAKRRCIHGKLKHPRGRRICRKAPRHGGGHRGRRHCKHGVVKRGRRKGQCLKHKRARKHHATVSTGYRRLVP